MKNHRRLVHFLQRFKFPEIRVTNSNPKSRDENSHHNHKGAPSMNIQHSFESLSAEADASSIKQGPSFVHQRPAAKCGWILEQGRTFSILGISMNKWHRRWYKILERPAAVVRFYTLDELAFSLFDCPLLDYLCFPDSILFWNRKKPPARIARPQFHTCFCTTTT
jgi:hypothetical protein